MRKHILTTLRKVAGVILIILGIVGAFVPIPVVPFFMLAIIGLGLLGVKPEFIERIKQRVHALSIKHRK